MIAWKNEVIGILKTVTANPASNIEMVFIILIALILAFFAITKTSKALKFAMADTGRIIAVMAFSITVALLAAVLANIYILPYVKLESAGIIVPVSAALLVLLATAIPLACLLLKSGYLQTLLTMVIGFAGMAVAVFLVRGISGALSHGKTDFDKTMRRKSGIEQVIGK